MIQSYIKNIILYLFCLCFFSAKCQPKTCNCSEYTLYEKEINAFLHNGALNIQEKVRFFGILNTASNPVCKAKAYEFLADIALQSKQEDSAVFYLKKAVDLYKLNDCTEGMQLNCYRIWADYFHSKANYEEAIKYCFKGLNLIENGQDNLQKTIFYSKIALNFIRLLQYDKALEYSLKSLPLAKKIPPSVEKAILLEDLASVFLVYHQVKIQQDYIQKTAKMTTDQAAKEIPLVSNDPILDTVSQLAIEAKNLSKEFGHTQTLLKSFRKLQSVEFWHNNMNKALLYIDSSLMYCVRGVHDNDLFIGYGDKADIYFKLKKGQLAAQYADSCLFYAQKTGIPLSIANAYLTKSDIAEFSGNWKDAFYDLRNVKIIMDSVQNIERTRVVNELEKKYNQAKNEKTIKELAQERRIYLLLALAALLGIIIFVFYMHQQSLKHKQTILVTEQRLNRARMNPHFFFNALTSLQSFALRENDGKMLAIHLSKFSQIMRETLENTYKEYVTIESEMDFLNRYLEIQKIRYPKKFSYSVEAHTDLEIDELMIPSMILQPFVENSIEHGFKNIQDKGHVHVFFKKENDEIAIEISDNGQGINTAHKTQNEYISRASQIIKDRIYLLNLKLKTKARFSIDNKTDSNGVLVKIFLPQILQNESLSH